MDCDDEYAEEQLTEEEKEYLKGFCDSGDLCLVRPLLGNVIELMIDLQSTITSRIYTVTPAPSSRTRQATSTKRQRLD
jgi:hypothetical protein